MRLTNVLTTAIVALSLGLVTAPAQAGVIKFNFLGLCDDCAGVGDLYPLNPANLDDDLFAPVWGVLTLEDYTPGNFLDFDNFVSFSYGGSSLADPFTVTSEEGSAFGSILADGTITSFLNVVFDGGVFSVLSTGNWSLAFTIDEEEGPCPDCEGPGGPPDVLEFDIGMGGAFTPVPGPGALALLGLGLCMLCARRGVV